jgi:tRNA(Ile)-lysidine synthase
MLSISVKHLAGKTVGVALSGGRDSVALLHLLKSAGLGVVGINVEHGIRGEASRADSKFVADLCASMRVPFEGNSVNTPAYAKEHKLTIEQAARELRYGIFEELLQCGLVDCIALGHHADDQTETILMRILRGTGVTGVAGMR